MKAFPFIRSVAIYLGSTFHLTQHMYFNSKLAGIELLSSDVVEIFTNFFNSREGAEGNPIDWKRERPDDVAELGRAMVKAYYPYAQKLQPVLVEYKLERETSYCTVYGTVDLVTSTGLVIDYKTSASMPYKNDLDGELQPTVYSFLFGGTVDFQYHYILKFKLPVVRIFYTKRYEEDLFFFENRILPSVINMIQSGIFPPLGKSNGACRWCPFISHCSAI
jgi:hypothetical protein